GRARQGRGRGACLGARPRRRRATASDAVVQLLRRVEAVWRTDGGRAGRLAMRDMRVSTPNPEQLLAIEPEEIERLTATVAQLLPPSLVPFFPARYMYFQLLCDEFVFRLALRVSAEIQLAEALHEWGTVDEVVACCGLEPRRSVVPVDWMLRHLAARGVLT